MKFFKSGDKLDYKKGEFVIRPGQAPTGVFLIQKGIVKAYDISKYGEENLLIIRKENEMFPLIWAVTGQERHIIYETLSIATLYHVPRDKFVNFMRDNPEAIPPILDMVTEMYRLHSERILNLEYRSVRERLISFLITNAARFGEKQGSTIVLTVPLRHKDIASSINATRETTSREIAYLERQNLIKNHHSFITIVDLKKLSSYL